MVSQRVRHNLATEQQCSGRQTTYIFPNTGYHLKSLPSFTTGIPLQWDLSSSLHRILKEYYQAQCFRWKLFPFLFNFHWLWNVPVVQSPTSAALLQSKLFLFTWCFPKYLWCSFIVIITLYITLYSITKVWFDVFLPFGEGLNLFTIVSSVYKIFHKDMLNNLLNE